MDKGLLIILSGPSGVGKGTVCTALRSSMPDLTYSVSATTRQPRQKEIEGTNYFFKTKAQFETMVRNGELLEWAEYVGNYYGTPRSFVNQTLDSGKDVILEIDVQGALKVKESFPDGVFIFLMPPSMEKLRQRIEGRGTESVETINNRMTVSVDELKLTEYYDYAVVNDEIALACDRIQCIITAEHCRSERFLPKIKKWIGEV